MEWLAGPISSAAAVLIVLGVPVFLLYAIGLRDYEEGQRRWSRGGVGREATGRAKANGLAEWPLRCWEVKHCPPEARERCPAPGSPEMACWQAVKTTLGGRVKDECPRCRMFLSC